jgi:flagellar protein FliS
MVQGVSDEYLRNAVLTATSEQLVLMLYDGAIRFSRQAKEAMERKDYETSCEKLLRAQRIVQELETGLRPEANAEVCRQMKALYSFINDRLLKANLKHETAAIDEALKVLEHQRQTWQMLLDKVRGDLPPPSTPAKKGSAVGVSLSVHG